MFARQGLVWTSKEHMNTASPTLYCCIPNSYNDFLNVCFVKLRHARTVCQQCFWLFHFYPLCLQELEAIKARVREMEEEAEKLKELQNEVEKQMNMSPPPGVSLSGISHVSFSD